MRDLADVGGNDRAADVHYVAALCSPLHSAYQKTLPHLDREKFSRSWSVVEASEIAGNTHGALHVYQAFAKGAFFCS
jgi:hypothetical protein